MAQPCVLLTQTMNEGIGGEAKRNDIGCEDQIRQCQLQIRKISIDENQKKEGSLSKNVKHMVKNGIKNSPAGVFAMIGFDVVSSH